MKRKTIYGATICLLFMTALVTISVKTDLFKYVFAHAALDKGWSMNDDGMITSDQPEGVEVVWDARPYPGPYLNYASNGEISEP